MDQFYMLRAFIETAKHRSFTKASEVLGVTPGAISKAIARLESDVHARLFHRTTRSLTLTEEAQSYYSTCCRLLDELNEANRRIMHEKETNGGKLRLVVHPTLVGDTLSRFVSAYRALAPTVSLSISVQERLVSLHDGNVDMAILPSHLIEQATVIRRTLTTTSRVLVASPDYLRKHGTPKRAAELAKHFLLLSRQTVRQEGNAIELLEDGEQVNVTPMSSLEGDEAVLRAAALGGAGIAVLPAAMIREELDTGELLEILPGCSTLEEDVEMCLFYPHREFLPLRLRTFADFCVEFFQATCARKTRGTVTPLSTQRARQAEMLVAA
jgi:DNA-binding transcriptional LysR family regulator